MDWLTADATGRALLDTALTERSRAYAPYSRFCVGAALQLADGLVVGGCNIENASYGLSICAERVAIFRAVSEGLLEQRAEGLPAPLVHALAVVGGSGVEPVTPCGACRQVLAEFAAADCPIWCGSLDGAVRRYTLAQLLPDVFRLVP